MGIARLLVFGLAAGLPGVALAHTGHGAPGSFASGLAHPLGGLDHVLAMVAVGLLAAHLGGRSVWALPLAFMGMMVAGGAVALFGLALPLVEFGILASVLVLGALIASGRSLPGALAAILCAAFAVFHGHAHGAEMPAAASAALYGAGFVLATGLLHALGIGLGWALGRFAPATAMRVAGAAIVLCGAGLVIG